MSFSVYLHVPFCASRCIYCGFYSTTFSHLKDAYVDAMCKEMERYGEGQPLATMYFGGGTPSQLSVKHIGQILQKAVQQFSLLPDAEITVECNPDDVTLDYARRLRSLGVNRVSVGIQTFHDARLRFLHRRHTAAQAISAVSILRQAGFSNISIDLMFGFPDETLQDWEEDLQAAVSLSVEHISAYSLMYEEGTALFGRLQEGLVEEIDEELSLKMYETLIDRLAAAGYEHYEISNFAKTNAAGVSKPSPFRSRHNSSYWNGGHYLGIGAAAHSYDGHRRWWNKSDVRQYITDVEMGESPVEDSERLSPQTKYNDLIATALRTCEGIDLSTLVNEFGASFCDYLKENAAPHLQRGTLTMSEGRLRLTRQGLFVSDDVMSDLIFVG